MRKKLGSIALVFALIVSILPSNAVHAAKKVKLNKTRLVLPVGKTYKLKLKNYKKKIKWSTSKKAVATVSKKGNVKAKKAGTAIITAKAGKKKYRCKVQVQRKRIRTCENWPTPSPSPTPAATPTPPVVSSPSANPTPDVPKRTLIYNYAPETPDVCNYDDFTYNSFCIWVCPFSFYGEEEYETKDYRGKKLHYELTVKNSGERDLPVLDLCFNYTLPTVYPTAYRIYDPAWKNADDLVPPVQPDPSDYPMMEEDEDGQEVEVTYEEALEYYEDDLADYMRERDSFLSGLKQPIKKGETYTYSFDFTIPEDAINGDYDIEAETNYPILLYISNQKAAELYQTGDEITILGFKIYETE